MSNTTDDFMVRNDTSFLRNFTAPALVITLRDSPRFGHSTDITALLGTKEESSDYVAGLVAAAFAVIVCFFVAFMSLPILMCLGKRRVGFLSGAPMKAHSEQSSSSNLEEEQSTGIGASLAPEKTKGPANVEETNLLSASHAPEKTEGPTSVDETQLLEEQNVISHIAIDAPEKTPEAPKKCCASCKYKCRKCCMDPSPAWVRATFVFSGIIFILFSILLVTQGVLNLQTTVDSVYTLASEIDGLALEAEDILRSGYVNLQSQASVVRDLITTELSGDNFCPADPTLQNSTAFAEIQAKAESASDRLTELNNFLGEEVENFSDSINDAAEGAREVQSLTGDVDIAGWKMAIILIPYTVVPFMLVLAAVLAHYDRDIPILNKANRWFFMPFFLILVIIAAGTASGMIAAASANSDFCLPGGNDQYPGTTPDTTVWRILDRKNHINDTERRIANYYIEQCQNVTDPYVFIRSYVPKVMDSRSKLDEFLLSFESSTTVAQLSAYCNRTYDSLDNLIVEMIGILDVLADSIQRTLNLTSCATIVPIYHQAFYDSSCAYSVSAVFWVFSSSLIMGSFGLLMLLFRSACKPTLYDADNHENIVYDEDLVNPDSDFVEDQNAVVSGVEDTVKEEDPVVCVEEQEDIGKVDVDANGADGSEKLGNVIYA